MPSIVTIAQNERFIGEKVQVVLKAIGKPYDDYLFVDLAPGFLSGAAFHFDAAGWIYIYIAESRHQPTFNATRQWDIELFLRERIESMEWEED